MVFQDNYKFIRHTYGGYMPYYEIQVFSYTQNKYIAICASGRKKDIESFAVDKLDWTTKIEWKDCIHPE